MLSTIYFYVSTLLVICLCARTTLSQDLSSGTDIFDGNKTLVNLMNQSNLAANVLHSSNSSDVILKNETTNVTGTGSGYPPQSPPVQQRNVQYGLALLYVFLFVCIVVIPFFYYNLFRCKCCSGTSPSSSRNDNNDEEQGRQQFVNSSSSTAIRFNIHDVSRNPPSSVRSLFTSRATYEYGANNNLPESYVERSDNATLKRKYIEEKIAQLRQLLVPYKLVSLSYLDDYYKNETVKSTSCTF